MMFILYVENGFEVIIMVGSSKSGYLVKLIEATGGKELDLEYLEVDLGCEFCRHGVCRGWKVSYLELGELRQARMNQLTTLTVIHSKHHSKFINNPQSTHN